MNTVWSRFLVNFNPWSLSATISRLKIRTWSCRLTWELQMVKMILCCVPKRSVAQIPLICVHQSSLTLRHLLAENQAKPAFANSGMLKSVWVLWMRHSQRNHYITTGLQFQSSILISNICVSFISRLPNPKWSLRGALYSLLSSYG